MPARTSTQSRKMLRWRATPVLLIAAAAGLGGDRASAARCGRHDRGQVIDRHVVN